MPSQSHTSWFHRAWVPAATQAGHPVVPRASKRANQVCPGSRQPGQFREVTPSSFQSACPSKHCESPTGHSCRDWGEGRGRAGGSEALTQPSNCTWLCLQPPPWGSSVGRKQKGSHPHIPPQSCTCAPPTLTTCWPAEYELGLLQSQSQERLGGGVGGWAGLTSTKGPTSLVPHYRIPDH